MAYCEKCGHQNNGDALFCSACGAPLKGADENAKVPPRWERIHLQREDDTSRDDTPPRREKSAGVWSDMIAKKEKAEKEFEKQQSEKKKKKGGCLRHILGWIIGLGVFFVLWTLLVKACSDEEDGGKEIQDPAKFERVMSQSSVDSLQAAIGFPQTTDDVAPLGGDYKVRTHGVAITVSLEPAQNGKVVGNAAMKLGSRSKFKGVYAYCGNSIYGIYENEEEIGGNPRNYFFARPDRESILMIDDGKHYTLERTVPFKGSGTNTLLSRDYEKCKDEASMAAIIKKEGFPETYEDNAPQFGTYYYKVEMNGETHSVGFQFEPYEGENKMIVARTTYLADEKPMARGFVGYCGFSIYASFLKEMDWKPFDEDDIELDRPHTNDYFYANPDGSISLYFDGSEKIRMKLGEVEIVDLAKLKESS